MADFLFTVMTITVIYPGSTAAATTATRGVATYCAASCAFPLGAIHTIMNTGIVCPADVSASTAGRITGPRHYGNNYRQNKF